MIRNYSECPVCSSTDIQLSLEAIDYTVSKEKFKIFQCNSCTFRFTQDIPGQNGIGKYYQSEDYISHSDTSKGFINKAYQFVRKRTLKSKKKLVENQANTSSGKILDYGCGTGAFLAVMKDAGWDALGLEPDEGARKVASEKHGLKTQPISHLVELADNQYDIITLWHVLEHVHELNPTINQLSRCLKEKGTMIIAVPNFQSLDAEKYGPVWAAWDVPRHLYHFSPASVRKLLSNHGFKVTETHRMPFDSFYVSMLSEKYRGGGMVGAMWTGFRSWVAAIFKKERCSSIIYVAKRNQG